MAKHKSFHSLAKKLDFIGETIESNSIDVTKRASFAALSAAIRATPVDKGVARAAWWVSLYDAPSSRPPLLQPENVDSAAETIRKGRAVIQGLRKEGSVFLTNTVPYIKYLEDGSSRQAPSGMTRFAIAAGRNVIRRSKLLGGVR